MVKLYDLTSLNSYEVGGWCARVTSFSLSLSQDGGSELQNPFARSVAILFYKYVCMTTDKFRSIRVFVQYNAKRPPKIKSSEQLYVIAISPVNSDPCPNKVQFALTK